MNRDLLFFAAYIFSFCLIAGCSSSQSTRDNDLKIQCTILMGHGGGFTGNYEGIYLDSTGKVIKWTGRTFDSARKSFSKQLNKDEIYSIINLIDTTGIQNTKYNEHGNVSSFMTIKTDKGEKRISWNGLEPDSEVPENIRRFYSAIKQITD